MTATFLAPYLVQRWNDNNGAPLVGGTITTYAGGTNTPIATYTDSTGLTPNTNPITLNFRGEASVWLISNTAYKFVVADSLGNQITTVDNVVNASLLSLFGGIDTGVANAYILAFNSPVPANTNGQVIFWLPANSNTGPSTINVNNAGPQPILNPNGTPLGANQILANQFVSIISINGTWQLYGGSGVGVNIGTFGAEVPLASAATTDFGSVPGHNVQITGSATVTSFGASAQIVAPIYIVRVSGTPTFTPSSSLIMPGNTPIIGANGDSFLAEYMGSGNWRILIYQYASGTNGTAVVKPADTTRISTTTLTADPDLITNTLQIGKYSYELFLLFDSVAAGAGFKFTSNGTMTDSRGAVPSVVSGGVNAAAYGPKVEGFFEVTIAFATVSTSVDGNAVLYKGTLLVSTAGTLGISWAQNTSTASNTILRAGSYLTTNLLALGGATPGITRIYTTPTGGATETIPAGFTTLTVEVWGAGGGGGARFASGCAVAGGGGGGSGGYCRTVIPVTGAGGQTMNYVVGAGVSGSNPGGLSSVSSGTFTIATMTSNGGIGGTAALSLTAAGTGGAGGTASGGTITNISGNTGSNGQTFAGGGGGGSGGIGIPGIFDGGTQGGNGRGTNAATAGGNGIVVFNYA